MLSPTTHSSTTQPLLAGPCLFDQSLITAWPSQRPFGFDWLLQDGLGAGIGKTSPATQPTPIRLGSRLLLLLVLLVITTSCIRSRSSRPRSDLRALADAKATARDTEAHVCVICKDGRTISQLGSTVHPSLSKRMPLHINAGTRLQSA